MIPAAPQTAAILETPKTAGGSLFERIGGEAVIRKVVDDLIARAADDPAVNLGRLGHANEWQATPSTVERLRRRLAEFLSVVADAPGARYDGKDMMTAHRGMGISDGEFDAFVGHLRDALRRNGIAERERRELLDEVEASRGAIVEGKQVP